MLFRSAAERDHAEAERALVDCAFGVAACDDAKVSSLSKQQDAARGIAERGYHEVVYAMTGLAASQAEAVERAAAAAGCNEPTW